MDEEERKRLADALAGAAPSTPPTSTQSGINPIPIIGDLMNHFEAMIQSHGEVTSLLMDLVERSELMSPEMAEARDKMVAAYQRYWTFKGSLVNQPKGGENEPG